MRNKLLIYSFLMLSLSLAAQSHYSFQLLATAKYTGQSIAIDDMGNIFIADHAKLTKLDAQANFFGRFYPPFQAFISSMDVHNPRRVLLWYKKYNYMVFLNQHLSMQNAIDPMNADYTDKPLDMEKLGKYDVVLACLDSYKGFWTYGEDMQDLCWYEDQNTLSFCTDSPLEEEDMTASLMLMSDDYLYLNFPEKGVVVFDADGHFVKLLPLEGVKHFYVYQHILHYVNANTLISVDVNTEETTYNILPIQEFEAWAMQMQTYPKRIAFLHKNGLSVYGMEALKQNKIKPNILIN